MIAQEWNSSYLHKSVLFGHYLHLILDVIVGVPVGSGCHQIFILNFNQLADNLETNKVKLL